MRPVVQAMAEKYGKDIKFIVADINTANGNELATKYNVMYIPAMFFINSKGETADTFVGTMTKGEFEDKLKKILQK